MHNYVEPREEDVISVIKKLKNRKSAGPDEITNEMLKYGGETLHKEIVKLQKQIFTNLSIPQEWKTSILIPIFKKGNKQIPDNYRGINLLNTVLKITTKIIHSKLSELITLSDEQQGFRVGRSCTDAIFIVRQITEKALEFNKPAFLCFIDLEKAFDSLQLNTILKILTKNNVPDGLIALILDIYSDNTVRIKVNDHLTNAIGVNKGVRQGDSLSPLLFIMVMEEIIKETKTQKGYKMGSKEIKMVCYADDVILVTECEDDLQRMLHQFNTSCQNYGFKISTLKTKSMVISKNPIRCKLELEKQIIEQVMCFQYLGFQLSSSGLLQTEILNQITKANRVSGYLNDTIWRNKYLHIEPKVRIYKTVVRPILTYAVEIRPETAKTKQMLDTTEMKTLRKIVGITRRDHIRNDQIREQCKIQPIREWTQIRRQQWNEHVSRMEEDRIARIARDNYPSGRRSPGRPLSRWRDTLD